MKKKKISSWCGKVCVEVNGPSCVAEFLQDPKKVIGIHLDLSGEHKSFIPASLAKKKTKTKTKKLWYITSLKHLKDVPGALLRQGIYYRYVEKRTCNVERCSWDTRGLCLDIERRRVTVSAIMANPPFWKSASFAPFFSKNQIILAEAHCSYFFIGFQAYLFLFCSCDSCELAKWGQRLEDEGSTYLVRK